MSISKSLRLVFASSVMVISASACQSSTDGNVATEPVEIQMIQDAPRGNFSIVKSRSIHTTRPVVAPVVVEEPATQIEEVVVIEEKIAPLATSPDCPRPVLSASAGAVKRPCLTTQLFATEELKLSKKQLALVDSYFKKMQRRRAVAH